MCGLVGMAGDISYQAVSTVFKNMLDVAQVRGRDSTGVIRVDKDLDYTWAKQVGPPNWLYESRVYENTIEKADTCVLIGHTRSKTVGDVNVKNAHPFDYPDEGICGVHNGTLRSYSHLDGYTFQKVDSEVLYNHLSKNGAAETFNDIDGAWACVWWDDNEKTLNFIRNDQRPLWFTWSKDGKTMFWASEPWMFGAVATKIELWDGGEQKKVYIELPINQLWSFRIHPKAKGDEKFVTIKPPVIIEKKKKEFGHGGTWRHGQGSASHWERQNDGTYIRPTPGNNLGTNKGGEVANPFQAARELLLDDPLPRNLSDGVDEGTNSCMSNVHFLNTSVHSSDSTIASRSSRDSARSTLSLPARNSITSLPKPKDEHSDDTAMSCSSSRKGMLRLLTGVSFREVSGIKYITNNTTKDEWSEGIFMANTSGFCTFCKEKVDDIRQVGEILDKNSFLCVSCLKEPKGNPIGEAACG